MEEPTTHAFKTKISLNSEYPMLVLVLEFYPGRY